MGDGQHRANAKGLGVLCFAGRHLRCSSLRATRLRRLMQGFWLVGIRFKGNSVTWSPKLKLGGGGWHEGGGSFWPTVRLVLMILIGPPILMSCVFIAISHLTDWGNPVIGWFAFTFSILVGLLHIIQLPIIVEVRVALGMFYIPMAGFALVIYSLYFDGIVFGNWL